MLGGNAFEAKKLQTIDDLVRSTEERVDLINGEIVKRPMARSDRALVQSSLSDEVALLKRRTRPGGWWIMPEISVKHGETQCPTHDWAGWRRARLPRRPTGIMDILPDWVCEITSPGHERKDLFHHFMLLQRSGIPHYWIVSPEDKTLIAYRLVDAKYHVVFSLERGVEAVPHQVRIPPFEEIEMDLRYIFGDGD